jgi:hypothetical protein
MSCDVGILRFLSVKVRNQGTGLFLVENFMQQHKKALTNADDNAFVLFRSLGWKIIWADSLLCHLKKEVNVTPFCYVEEKNGKSLTLTQLCDLYKTLSGYEITRRTVIRDAAYGTSEAG